MEVHPWRRIEAPYVSRVTTTGGLRQVSKGI